MHPSIRSVAAVALAAWVAPSLPCMAREKATVTVAYVLGPAQPLPEGLKAVAVIDAGVQTRGAQQDEREQKWSAMAADMIEAMLQNSAAEYGAPLAVAKRSLTRRILEEQDLRLSGLVDGDTATRAGKLLAVQGLITTRMTIDIDVRKGSKSSLDWTAVLGGALEEIGGRDRDRGRREYRVRSDPRVIRRPPPGYVRVDPRARDPRVAPRRTFLYAPGYRPTRSPREETSGGAFGGFAFKTKEVEAISRSLMVQCSFSLVDATTGRAIAQYSPPPYRKTDSSAPDFLFGGMVEQADLDPVDQFIGELVERATREFVGTLVPVRFEHSCNLALSGSHGKLAIRAIRADDYATAVRELEAAAADGKDDDGSVSYALGVVSELMGDYARAQKMYRQAASAPDVDKDLLPTYLAAKDRMTSHLHRIMVPSATPPSASAPTPAPTASALQPEVTIETYDPSARSPGETPAPAHPQAVPPRPVEPAPAGPSSVDDEIRILKELESKGKPK